MNSVGYRKIGSPEDTFFAPAGRDGVERLVLQIQHSLEDPCIKAVLEAVNGFVLILNKKRQILGANRELLKALNCDDLTSIAGLRPGEALNCVHFTEGTDGCGTSRHCRTCGAVISILASQAQDGPFESQCHLSIFRDENLQAIDFHVRATPLEIQGEKLTVLVLHDISALKRREILEQVFLHDFLNTLGGISSWSEALKNADEPTAAREIVDLVDSLKEEVVTQRTLLDAERGELAVNFAGFNASDVIDKLRLIFKRNAVAKGKSLDVLPLPERTWLVSDRVLLLRVLLNMVKNAFEATKPGGVVRLGLEWNGDTPTFVVQNAGVIADDTQSRIFERSFSTHSGPGRGIGTYSMKLYGENFLHGKVSFTSGELNGTRFFFSLPAQPSKLEEVRLPKINLKPVADRSKAILLVDDDERLLRLGELFLLRLGFRVTTCDSGSKALEIFSATPDSFSVVITDWSMPKMNGAELVEKLLRIRSNLPVIACSGLGESEIENPGVRAFMWKPFNFEELKAALEEVIN